MSNEISSRASRIQPQQLFYWLMLLTTLILASAVVIEYNNSVRSAPIYLFLLIFGIGITAALGMVQGGLLALFLVSIWITVKQATGVWTPDRLLLNMLELVTVTATFMMAAFYRRRLQVFISAYNDGQMQLKKLDLEDRSVGLIKASVGLLRLREEEERSVRYKRPFSLVLIRMQPGSETELTLRDSVGLMRALAATIKDTTRDVDIPFLAASDTVALILPETETTGANKVVSNIVKSLLQARFINRKGFGAPIRDFAHIRFGFATFLGWSNSPIDMLSAAQESLQKSLESNTGDLFQNLFIEWMTLGESHLTGPILEEDIRFRTNLQSDTPVEEEETFEEDTDLLPKEHGSALQRLIQYFRSLY